MRSSCHSMQRVPFKSPLCRLSAASSMRTLSISLLLLVFYRLSMMLLHCPSINISLKQVFYLTVRITGLMLRLLWHSGTPLFLSVSSVLPPQSPPPNPTACSPHVYWTQIRVPPWQPRLPGNLVWAESKVPPGWH